MTDEERRAKRAEYMRRWNRANPEKTRDCKRRHRARINAEKRAWAKANPEKIRAMRARYFAKHFLEIRAKAMERQRKAFREKPEETKLRFLIAGQRRRARIAGATGSLSAAEWFLIIAAYEGHCAYCDKVTRLTMDHVIALASGGSHDIGNVVPACHPCNSRKWMNPWVPLPPRKPEYLLARKEA